MAIACRAAGAAPAPVAAPSSRRPALGPRLPPSPGPGCNLVLYERGILVCRAGRCAPAPVVYSPACAPDRPSEILLEALSFSYPLVRFGAGVAFLLLSFFVLVPVRASPVPSVVRESFVVKFFLAGKPSPSPVWRVQYLGALGALEYISFFLRTGPAPATSEAGPSGAVLRE